MAFDNLHEGQRAERNVPLEMTGAGATPLLPSSQRLAAPNFIGILGIGHPIHRAAEGEWVFRPHAFGEAFLRPLWKLIRLASAVLGVASVFIWLALAIEPHWDSQLSSALYDILGRDFSKSHELAALFPLAVFVAGTAFFVLWWLTGSQIAQLQTAVGRGFFLKLDFQNDICTSALEFNRDAIQWMPKGESSLVIPDQQKSALQNWVARLYDQQKNVGGRIRISKIELPKNGKGDTYRFAFQRPLIADAAFILACSIPALTMIGAYGVGLTSQALTLISDGGPASLTQVLFVGTMLLAVCGLISVILQQSIAAKTDVAVIFQDHTAQFEWTEYLGVLSGFHNDMILLQNIGTLRDICGRLLKLQKTSYPLKLTPLAKTS